MSTGVKAAGDVVKQLHSAQVWWEQYWFPSNGSSQSNVDFSDFVQSFYWSIGIYLLPVWFSCHICTSLCVCCRCFSCRLWVLDPTHVGAGAQQEVDHGANLQEQVDDEWRGRHWVWAGELPLNQLQQKSAEMCTNTVQILCVGLLWLLWSFCVFVVKLIAECEQVKTERESDLIIDQVLIAMSAMGLDRERTLQVGAHTTCDWHVVVPQLQARRLLKYNCSAGNDWDLF